ncbi:hypothetical protein NX059_006385 [Plenodomus lindquistii]|nr:hypothetical protein NX059_006385 [Plenodomus lindquistii]
MSGRQGPPSQQGPPYPPQDAGLGGTPTVVPDDPISAIFLVLYLIFGVIHIKIFKKNKHRGHKFIFNGAILGLCKVRIVTMILRIIWSSYPRNTGLAIAANIFVYVGTIILYGVNWFFVQRIIRAQHTHLGWSTPYRIFHRGALVLLIIALLILIVSQVTRNFTLNQNKLDIFRALFLASQTYFTIFCVAPAVLVAISLIIPRTEVEKFGAGRLRVNITILLVAVAILSTGQIFRCVLAWIPQFPLPEVQRGSTPLPWYLSKPCFYLFNFVTEIAVVIMFAVGRVDLRFHVPNGSRKSGDYSSSRVNLNKLESQKTLASSGGTIPAPMIHKYNSNETLHRYQSSIFEDTQTLADSLRYPSSKLEVDLKTGDWKVRRSSGETSSTRSRVSFAPSSSKTTLRDPHTIGEVVPPVPDIPAEWPLPDAVPPRGSNPVLEHSNPISRRGTPKRHYEIEGHQLNDIDVGDAVSGALSKLEMNSERNKTKSPKPPTVPKTPPPHYSRVSPISPVSPVHTYQPTLPNSDDRKSPSRTHRKRNTYPLNHPLNDGTRYRPVSNTQTPRTTEAPALPKKSAPVPPEPTRRSPSLEIMALLNHMSSDSSRVVDASLQRDEVSTVAASEEPASGVVTRQSSSKYSEDTTSSDAREAGVAVEEFRRFSYEAPSRKEDV